MPHQTGPFDLIQIETIDLIKELEWRGYRCLRAVDREERYPMKRQIADDLVNALMTKQLPDLKTMLPEAMLLDPWEQAMGKHP